MTNRNFNIIITGVGGQGTITLVSVLNEASFIEGYDIRSSELHGLSQRGGSVEIHIKFGKKVYSPLVAKNGADLLIGLELSETVRALEFASPETKVLANKHIFPYLGGTDEQKLLDLLKNSVKSNFSLVEASKICQEKLQKEVLAGIYLLGHAVNKKLIPLKSESILRAVENVIPEKFQEMNKQAFNLANF